MDHVRITYEKSGAMRYTSHLELQRIWVRTLLRAKIPLAYTQGFHPAPKMSPAWPLALGWTGCNELIDFWTDYPEGETTDPEAFRDACNRCAPPGLRTVHCGLLPYSTPALTTIIESADYTLTFQPSVDAAALRVQMEGLMSREEIPVTRRKKTFDMKPLILSWDVDADGSAPVMRTRLVARDSAMGRPDELAALLGYDMYTVQFARVRYQLKDG